MTSECVLINTLLLPYTIFLFIVQFALGCNLFLTKAWFRSHTSHNLSHIKQKIEFDLAYVNYSM